MRDPSRRDPTRSKKQQKPASADTLTKTAETIEKDRSELNEEQLDKASGGRKAGGTQQDYIKVTMSDVLIT
jgi:hypothetical protein